jgi:hypothetical protein
MSHFRTRLVAAFVSFSLPVLAATSALAFMPEDELNQRDFMANQAARNLRTGVMQNELALFRKDKITSHGGYWYLTSHYDGFEQAVLEAETAAEIDELAATARSVGAKMPNRPEATTILGTVLLARAVRQGTDQRAQPPQDQIAALRTLLDDAKPNASADPHWYTLRIRVALAEHRPMADLIALAQEAAGRFPDYAPPYLTVAEVIFTDPKSGKRDLEIFAQKIASLTQPSFGMSAYALIYQHAVESAYGNQLSKASAVTWADLKTGIHDVLDKYKYSGWNQNYFAMMACQAEDMEETQALLTPIESQGITPPNFVWGSTDFFEACRAWAKGKARLLRPLQANPFASIRPKSRLLVADTTKRQTSEFESNMRDRIGADATAAFWNEQFEVVEAMADKYRQPNQTTPAGASKLSKFYHGFSSIVPEAAGKAQADTMLGYADDYLKAYPKSPTPILVKVKLLEEIAWNTRGRGYAKEVTPYQWRAFTEQITNIAWFLETHQAVASQDPEYYAAMSRMALYQGWPREDQLAIALNGLAKFPLYDGLYQNIVNSLTPKWGGDAEELDAFVTRALEKMPVEDRDMAYTFFYWIASTHYENGELFTKTLVRWERMKKGYVDLITRHPSNWNRSAFAYRACQAGDAEAARTMFDAMQATGDQTMKPSWGEGRYAGCEAWTRSQPMIRPQPKLTIPAKQPS